MDFLAVSSEVKALYHELLSRGDPRVRNWGLMSSPKEVLSILAVYLVVVYSGPLFMKNRQALNLRNLLFLYNFFMVLVSAYLFGEIFQVVYQSGYNLLCQPVDTSTNPLPLRMARVLWLGFLTKIFELVDTVFFILHKKNSHITFLHVYHHCSIVINCWVGCKYVPGGQSFMIGLANTFVHIFMYTYYGLAALGPSVRKYLWWKKHLTQLQLAQFFLVFAHIISGLVMRCGYSVWISIYQLAYTLTLIALFINFYVQAYFKRKPFLSKKKLK